MNEGEPRKLSRSEQKRLVEALRIALMWCDKRGTNGEIWRSMLYEANLGYEPKELWRMRNLLKGIVGRDPLGGGAQPKGERQPNAERPKDRQTPSPTLVRAGKAGGRNPAMHGHGKSDRPIRPAKLSNKAGQPAAETVEERCLAKENVDQQNTSQTQRWENGVSNALDRVRQAAHRCRNRLSGGLSPLSEVGAR